MIKRLTNFSWRTKLIWDIIIAVAILIVPLFIYSHLLFSKVASSSVSIFGMELNHGFANLQTFIWYLLTKCIPILLCTIWFITCINRWRYFILIPVALYSYSVMDTLCYAIFKDELLSVMGTISGIIVLILLILGIERNIVGPRFFLINKISYKILRDRRLYRKLMYHLKLTDGVKSKISTKEYSARLQYIRNIILERFNVSNLAISDISFENSGYKFKIPAILLILFPLVYFSHYFIPTGSDSMNILWFEMSSNGFKDMNTFYWFLLTKFTVLLLLVIWYISTNIWWRYGLLSPIILYTYQFIDALYDVRQLDAYTNLKVLPAVVAIILIIVVLSHVVRYNYGIFDLYESIDKELDNLIEKVAKKELKELKKLDKVIVKSSRSLQGSENLSRLEHLYKLKKEIKFKLKPNS